LSKPIQSSSLLINEDPLQVLPTLAEKVGLNEAIVLQQVHYWLRKEKNIIEGRKWTYDTYEKWQQKNFKFWSVKTVQRVFLSLEEQKLLISMQPEKRDRRKWYTIDYDRLEKLASDSHTHDLSAESFQPDPPDPPTSASGQLEAMQEDNLSLSDVTTCPDARGQLDLLEKDKLSPPSGQDDLMYIKDSENSTEISRELTHSHARARGDGRKVCECSTPHRSKLCDEERIQIARNISSIRVPESYAMSAEVRRGRDDAMLLKRKKELQKPAEPIPERDTSQCPDCHGKNFYYPHGDTIEGRAKGVKKCDHRRLDEEMTRLEREYNEAKEEISHAV